MTCPKQLECINFNWQHKTRSHHVRLAEKCLSWKDDKCAYVEPVKEGAACDLEKIRRIRKEHGFGTGK